MKPRLTDAVRQTLQQGARLLDAETRLATAAAVRRDWLPCGAAADHAGQPDAYFTLFCVFCCDALEIPFDAGRLRRHLAAGRVPGGRVAAGAATRIDQVCRACLESRVGDAGFWTRARAAWHGAAALAAGMREPYAAFWGCLALESAAWRPPWRLLSRLVRVASTDATSRMAAQLAVMAHGGRGRTPAAHRVAAWLQTRRAVGGGYRAGDGSAEPDLLSTATAVFALAQAGAPETADQARGTFAFTACCLTESGHWADRPGRLTGDCEFTFYALLALGSGSP